MMQAFVSCIFVVIVRMIFFETRHKDKVPNFLGLFFEYFDGNDTIIDNDSNLSDEKFVYLTNGLLNGKPTGLSRKEPPTNSKCGYDVSYHWTFLAALFFFIRNIQF